jgi:hypothetical protein
MNRERAADRLAVLLSVRRTGGHVYMDGRHNPLPTEHRDAQRFIDDLIEHGWHPGGDIDTGTVKGDRLIIDVDSAHLYRIRNRDTGLCYVMPVELYNVLYCDGDFDLVEKVIASAHTHEREVLAPE